MDKKITLRKARETYNWTSSELANAAGISQPAVIQFETGKHHPTDKTKEKIERVTGPIIDWAETYNEREYNV